MPWTESINRGIQKELAHYKPRSFLLDTEYLDLYRNTNPVYANKIKEFLAIKYKNKIPDLVIIEDLAAAEFYLKYKKELFPDTPLILSFNGITFKLSLPMI